MKAIDFRNSLLGNDSFVDDTFPSHYKESKPPLEPCDCGSTEFNHYRLDSGHLYTCRYCVIPFEPAEVYFLPSQ